MANTYDVRAFDLHKIASITGVTSDMLQTVFTDFTGLETHL